MNKHSFFKEAISKELFARAERAAGKKLQTLEKTTAQAAGKGQPFDRVKLIEQIKKLLRQQKEFGKRS
jgi:hypothetical protein